jgi:hypothetical protein
VLVKLTTGRSSHACERVTWQNPSTGQSEDVVVVAGGFNYSRILNSVEFLFLNDPNVGWTFGPDIPQKAVGQVMIEYQVSISPTFYVQLLRAHIPKAQKRLTTFFARISWTLNVGEIDSWCQFHQHSTSSFWARRSRKHKKYS